MDRVAVVGHSVVGRVVAAVDRIEGLVGELRIAETVVSAVELRIEERRLVDQE